MDEKKYKYDMIKIMNINKVYKKYGVYKYDNAFQICVPEKRVSCLIVQ